MVTPRESIWSVTRRTRILYFATFSVLVTISVVLVSTYETVVSDKDTLYDTLKAIWTTSSQMVPAWVVFSLILAELGDWTMVLAEMFREKRMRDKQKREQEALAEGRAQGRDEGRAEGRALTQAHWQAWNSRRLEAEKNSLPFNEPPPSLEDSNNGNIS